MSRRATERAERQIDRAEDVYARHGRIFRTMWLLTAVVVIAAGLAMTVFPGPVTVVIPAGLAMLAAVFGWARRLLLKTVEKGAEAKERVEDLSTQAKALGAVAVGLLAAAALAAAAALVLT